MTFNFYCEEFDLKFEFKLSIKLKVGKEKL